MKHSWTKLVPLGLLSVAGMVACTDNHASTEVENELQVALTGIAATGAACALASVEIYAPDGSIVAKDTTDSSGAFLVSISLDSEQLPLLVRIEGDSATLYTFLNDTTLDRSADTLFALANPLTTLVARQQLGSSLAQPSAGFTPPPQDSIRAVGERAMLRLFGDKVAWHDFYKDPAFKPYDPGHPENGAGANDALLHTLGDEAKRLGMTIDAYLDSLYQKPPEQGLLEQEFRFQVASNMVMLGVDSAEATRQIRNWQPDSTEMEGYYNALRDNQRDNPPPDGEFTPQNTARRATDDALQLVAKNYTGTPQYDSAMSNLPQLADIVFSITDNALLPLRDSGLPPESMDKVLPYAEEVANMCVQVTLEFSPTDWSTRASDLKDIAQSVIAAHVIGAFDVKAYATSADPAAYYSTSYKPWRPSEEDMRAAVDAAETALAQ